MIFNDQVGSGKFSSQQIVSATKTKNQTDRFFVQIVGEFRILEILHRKCCSIKIQAETAFDQIVGAIEDIVIDDRFQDLQTDLLEKHFHHFDVSTSTLTKRQKQKDK